MPPDFRPSQQYEPQHSNRPIVALVLAALIILGIGKASGWWSL
jgi:hypothetical protein